MMNLNTNKNSLFYLNENTYNTYNNNILNNNNVTQIEEDNSIDHDYESSTLININKINILTNKDKDKNKNKITNNNKSNFYYFLKIFFAIFI
jgi:hypothetical protein